MVGELCGPTSLLLSDLQKNADDKSLLQAVIRPLEKASKAITFNDSVVSCFDGVDRTKEDSKRRTYWACNRQPVIIIIQSTQQINKATSTYILIQNSAISYITRHTKKTLRGRKKPIVFKITARFSI